MALRSLTPVAITALPNASTPLSGTEAVAVVQSGTTSQVAVSDLTAGRAVSASALTASSGNLTFSGTAQRITGDMSNATQSNRLAFQTSTTNGVTTVYALPNGTATFSAYRVFNNADPTNAAFLELGANGSTEARLVSSFNGTGTYLPMTFYTGGSERMRIDTSGNVAVGTTNAGTAGLSLSQGYNLSWEQSATESIANLFRQTSSAALVMSVGYKRSATANGFASSFGSSLAKTAISLGTTAGAITFYTDTAATTAVGTDVTPTERMRIDSSGNVGIGTTSPVNYGGTFTTLAVNNSGAGVLDLMSGGVSQFRLFGNASENRLQGVTNVPMTFYTNNTERMRLDSSGNLGLGVTPSAWGTTSSIRALQLTMGAFNSIDTGTGGEIDLVKNAYFDGGSWRYVQSSSGALRYRQYQSEHAWFNAGTGTAGNTISFTQAMTLDASGNLLVGTTAPLTGSSRKVLTLNSAAGQLSIVEFGINGTIGGYVFANGSQLTISANGATNTSPITFEAGATERMRIDSSGNVGIGTTSPGSFNSSALPLVVGGGSGNTGLTVFSGNASFGSIHFADTATTGAGSYEGYINYSHSTNSMNFGTGAVARVAIDSSGNVGIGTTSPSGRVDVFTSGTTTSNLIVRNGTVVAVLFVDSGAGYTGTTTNHPQLFLTNNTERMRIDSSGNVGIGTSSPQTALTLNATSAVTQVSGYASSTFIYGFGRIGNGIAWDSFDYHAFYTNSTTGPRTGSERMRITATGNVVAGGSVALATTATDGFLYVPTCAGTPTGTPTAITGMAPIVVNTTNNKLYFYSGGAWRDAGP